MQNDVRNELFSIRADAGSRTYFFDVKESQDGTRYLVVSESRRNGAGGHDHQRVMVFEEHLEEFQRAMTEAISHLQTLREPAKAYSVDEVRRDHAMAYAKWTPEDDRRLWDLHRSGRSVSELAAAFNRKVGAIESRLRKLAMRGIGADRRSTATDSKQSDGDFRRVAPREPSGGPIGEIVHEHLQSDREPASESDLPF